MYVYVCVYIYAYVYIYDIYIYLLLVLFFWRPSLVQTLSSKREESRSGFAHHCVPRVWYST